MIRSTKDFWAGLIYIFFGACAIIIARDYTMGTALRMGPAYFPSLLGALLLLIGAIALVRSFFAAGTPIGGFALKGLSLVIASVVLFGFIVRGAGLVVALPLLVVISAPRQFAFPLGPDARDGGRTDDLLRVRVYQRLGHSSADDRSVVRRLVRRRWKFFQILLSAYRSR